MAANQGWLLPFRSAIGKQQMAWDWQLLDWQIAHDQTGWLLRFYDWSPPALSVGYHQKVIPEEWREWAKALNIDLVRRPSGGRAVLHSGCLTYALICPQLYRSRLAMYEYLCRFLLKGMNSLGILLRVGAGESYKRSDSCFHSHTRADLVTTTGLKLIGNAQLYRCGSVLQHGSIVIQPQRQWLTRFFGDSQAVGAIAELPQFSQHSIAQIKNTLIQALVQSAEEQYLIRFRNEAQQESPCQFLPLGNLSENAPEHWSSGVGFRESG